MSELILVIQTPKKIKEQKNYLLGFFMPLKKKKKDFSPKVENPWFALKHNLVIFWDYNHFN